jgi:hypothetical protein
MELRRFLVTGCGRSGTGYVSRLLTGLGAECGHELLFEVGRLEDDVPPAWPESVWGESSWLAAPFLETLAPGTVVLHQVRHPLAVVRSFARQNFFGRRHPWRAFSFRHCPELAEHPPMVSNFLYWLRWNRMAEAARSLSDLRYLRYRVEELDRALLERILEEIGLAASGERVAAELGSLSKSTNTAGDRSADGRIGWDALTDRVVRDELLELAERYGYSSLATTA